MLNWMRSILLGESDETLEIQINSLINSVHVFTNTSNRNVIYKKTKLG